MIEKFIYLILMFVFYVIPTSYLWIKYRKHLIKYKRIFAYALIASTIVAYFWDYIAVQERIWFFTNILGIWILGLPLEEWLFFWLVTIWVVSLMLVLIKGEKK